jgi:hypothetical protein
MNETKFDVNCTVDSYISRSLRTPGATETMEIDQLFPAIQWLFYKIQNSALSNDGQNPQSDNCKFLAFVVLNY